MILISCLGLGLDYVFMALAPSLTLLFVGRVISGITSATIGTAFAYIADVTPPDDRAQAFGMVGVAFGLGFVVGPAIGGLLGSLDPRLPFWVSAAACLINAALRLVRAARIAAAGAAHGLRLEARQSDRLAALLARASRAAAAWRRSTSSASSRTRSLPAVFVLYAGYRYGWGETIVGLTLAFVGVCSAVVQGVLVGPIVARLGERADADAGPARAARWAWRSTAWRRPARCSWLGVPVMALWGLAGPALQGLMSRLVSPSEQGQLQGAKLVADQRRRPDRARRCSPATFAWLLGRAAGRALDPGGRGPAGRRGRAWLGYEAVGQPPPGRA